MLNNILVSSFKIYMQNAVHIKTTTTMLSTHVSKITRELKKKSNKI